jgi:hypothetical protein
MNMLSVVYFNLTLFFSISSVTHIFIEMARFYTQDNQCEICDEKRGTGACFSPSVSVSRYQHSSNALHFPVFNLELAQRDNLWCTYQVTQPHPTQK